MKYHPSEQDLLTLTSQCVDSLQPLMMNKKIQSSIENHSQQTNCLCDGKRILQVMTNLLSNAIKFAPNDSNIRIRFENKDTDDQSLVIISIIDQGSGIPEDELETILTSSPRAAKPSQPWGAGRSLHQ